MQTSLRSDDAVERRLRVMPWWLVLLGLTASVAAGWFVITWLLSEADAGTERGQVRIEAIRTGIAVVVVAGGALALLLAARRQWLSERAQRHQERVAAHDREHGERVQAHEERLAAVNERQQEQRARSAEYDATERRLTELYARAVEQLGSDHAAVRLGGLYALERLAQNSPEHRQTILDVFCAYLRMPYEPPTDPSTEPPTGQVATGDAQERQVRQTAQRIVARHLRPSQASAYWPDLQIDLVGAVLVDFDASYCSFSAADFANAVFVGDTRFTGAAFEGLLWFAGTRFTAGTAIFHQLQVSSDAFFDGVSFRCPAEFDGADFAGTVSFGQTATFTDPVSFRSARFQQSCRFDGADFGGEVSFEGVVFERGASFEHAIFEADVTFVRALFQDMAMLRRVEFGGDASFQDTAFERHVAFVRTVFSQAVTFDGATFGDDTWFDNLRATRSADRTWPAGYREVEVDNAWVSVEPEPAAS